ncbi:tunnelling fold family protein, partial [Acidithiobacillus sp.]
MPSQPSKALERFPNPHPERDYVVHMDLPEFTCLCPLTGQPDFARFMLDFIPDQHN